MLDEELRRRGEELFHAVFRLPPAERRAYLDAHCSDARVRDEVEDLLAHAEKESDAIAAALSRGPRLESSLDHESRLERDSAIERIGDYRLIRKIGQGGMGEVFEAVQESLDRRVALKVLRGLGLSEAAVERFHREAMATARLHHPNIVSVYAEGQEQGVCYYAMELVDGEDLGAAISRRRGETRDGPKRFDALARQFAEAAEALDYAHERGVIHRDVKPSNLMLGRDGRLKLMDFGLARLLEQPGMTVSGEFLGTPAYMSPEQIAAGRAEVDRRTDVYSLGVTLYEALTFEAAFPGASRDRIIERIMTQEPRGPRKIDSRIPVDLETICLKAIEKAPDRRYQTAALLAEDLRRYAERKAITARRTGPAGRATRWMRRRPALAAALLCVVLFAVLAGALGYRAHRSGRTALEHARERTLLIALSGDRERASQAIAEFEGLGGSRGWTHLLRGQIEMQGGRTAEAVRHLEQAVSEMPQSAAAHGMLARAYLYGGQVDRALATLQRMSGLALRSPEDFLFGGQAVAIMRPRDGLMLLDEAVRRRDSSLARLFRSVTRMELASDTGDLSQVELALEDLSVARAMLPDHPYAMRESVTVHFGVALAHRRAGRTDEAERFFGLVRDGIESMESRPELLDGINVRGWYYELQGHEDAALAAWRQEAEAGSVLSAGRYMSSIYRTRGHQRGELERALEVCDRLPDEGIGTWVEVERGYVLTDLDRERALRVYRELARRAREGDVPFYPAILYPTLARLLGSNEEADQLSRDLREYLLQPLEAAKLTWLRARLDFNCGSITDEEYLKFAGPSNWNRCEGHFDIALRRLADRDRRAAREHFRAAVDTGILMFVEYAWARAFLARLEENEEWPRWIP